MRGHLNPPVVIWQSPGEDGLEASLGSLDRDFCNIRVKNHRDGGARFRLGLFPEAVAGTRCGSQTMGTSVEDPSDDRP